MHGSQSRKKLYLTLLVGGAVLLAIILLIAFIVRDTGNNQFGKRIKIQNYDAIVKNLSSDMKDAIESHLYTVIALNASGELSPITVKDVYIREDSHSQEYSAANALYDGNFIVDSESLGQSYRTQYSYSEVENNVDTGSSPVFITCLPVNQLIYGEFDCKDLTSSHNSSQDIIMVHLPYRSFGFQITPSSNQDGELVLDVSLTIPSVDLSGGTASKRVVVKMYKDDVLQWIRSKGADPADYILRYNYDDNGNST